MNLDKILQRFGETVIQAAYCPNLQYTYFKLKSARMLLKLISDNCIRIEFKLLKEFLKAQLYALL